MNDMRGCDCAMGLKLPGKACVGVDQIVKRRDWDSEAPPVEGVEVCA